MSNPRQEPIGPADPLDYISVSTFCAYLAQHGAKLEQNGTWTGLDRLFELAGTLRSELVTFAGLCKEGVDRG